MLLGRIQRDLFDFTDSESDEDFGPLLNFWYRANTPAISAALTAHPGLTMIVDAPSVGSFESLLKKLFLLADTIVLRDLRGQVPEEEAVREYLIPDSGYRPGHLDHTIEELKSLRPSLMTMSKPTPYGTSSEKVLSTGTAHYAIEMGDGTPQEIIKWIGKRGRSHLETGRVVYAPFIPPKEMEFEFAKNGVDLPSYFNATPFFHLQHEWLSSSNLDALFSLKIPFLNGLDLETIARVKADYHDEFSSFSRVILEAIQGVTSSIGTEQFASDVHNIQRNQIDAGISDVQRTFKRIESLPSLRKKGVAIALLGLNAAAHLGAPPVALASGLAASGVKMVADMISRLKEEQELREMDYYFLWKMKQESR